MYRPCAGAVVFNAKGQILVCSRVESDSFAWQFPQGGIEKGESPLETALRELFEETSIVSVVPIYTSSSSIRYEFSQEIKENFRKRGIMNDGQDICFSLFFFTGSDDEINVHTSQPEFKEYAWKDFDFAINNVIFFKKEVYRLIAKEFKPIILQYLCSLT